MLRRRDESPERGARRELPRGFRRRVDSPGICGTGERLVGTGSENQLCTLGCVEGERLGKGREGYLGPHRALAELQHRKSSDFAGICVTLFFTGGGAGSGRLADPEWNGTLRPG